MIRHTFAEINLDNLIHNYRVLRSYAGSSKFIAVVKADAYGHGAVRVARTLEGEGVFMFAVATVEEAVELREGGVKTDILIFGPVVESWKYAVGMDFVFTLTSFEDLRFLKSALKDGDFQVRVHINIDTGMGRLGVKSENFAEFIREIRNEDKINLEGLYTHFPVADTDKEFTMFQLQEFLKITEGFNVLKHTANTGALILYPETHLDAVRPGIGLYGSYPGVSMERPAELKPVMTLKTHIVQIKKMRKGETTSYGRTYRFDRNGTLGVLPIGYADGIPTLHSNNMEVLIRGERVKVIGRVCMDYTMINLTDFPCVKIGEEVVIFGYQRESVITPEEFGLRAGAIPYEVTCSVSKRVPRVYV